MPIAVTAVTDATAAEAEPVAAPGPAGIWNCIVYDDPLRGQERAVLVLESDGGSFWARQSADAMLAWRPIGDWTIRRRTVRFSDPRQGRDFEAEVRGDRLSGRWLDGEVSGGWWCARRQDAVALEPSTLRRSSPEFFIPPLVPNVVASPRYPLEAIRIAKEGRAVVCYLVDASGALIEPEIVESSDEMFNEPALDAVNRTHYRPRPAADSAWPGCRRYDFQLKIAD